MFYQFYNDKEINMLEYSDSRELFVGDEKEFASIYFSLDNKYYEYEWWVETLS